MRSAMASFLAFVWWFLCCTLVLSDVIPLIDLKRSSSDSEIAQQIRTACQEIGFFAVVNHGIDDATVQRAWEASRAFFDQPESEKQKYITRNTTEYPYGYEQSESLTRGKAHDGIDDSTITGNKEGSVAAPDLKETFAIGPSNPESGMPPRQFPSQPDNFKAAVEDYYSSMEDLAMRLLRLFAIALELPPSWFEDKMDHHQSALRLLNYPSLGVEESLVPGQLRAGAHTDYGALTILKSGGPGLQVLRQDNEWVDVPYLEDAFVINVGDLMQRWTNDKWRSTLHRVVKPPPPTNNDSVGNRRMSIAFFVNMNGDAHVEPIESCGEAKYAPITAGQHLLSKHLASMGEEL